jgi:N-acetylglucosaminyl-diphospho-decaprenol L-rhamnosyltransferase
MRSDRDTTSKMTPEPCVDAVVVSYNSESTLPGCVAPLTGLPWVAVTVVDNSSSDGSADSVAPLPVRLVRASRNGGFSYGCNLGIREGRAPYLLLLNPDARIDENSLATLLRVLGSDARVGAVGPRLLDGDGALAWSQRRFPRLRSTFSRALFLHRIFPRAGWSDELIRDPAAYGRVGNPDWLSGACLLVRRNALEEVGGLDEGFFLYSEDTDLFRRLRDAGWEARFEPTAVVRHEGGASAPRYSTERIAAGSRIRYARKHHGRLIAALEAAGIALEGLTHAAVSLYRPAWARGYAAAALVALASLYGGRLRR